MTATIHLQGQALLDDIAAYEGPAGEFAYWWLGQHSFVVKIGGTVIYIDPFLSNHPKRNIPPLIDPAQATGVDLILGTHDHTDHIDRKIWPDLAAASPGATFVVPRYHRETLARDLNIPLERLIGLDDGERHEAGEVSIHAIPSAHELVDPDPATGLHPFLGFVIAGHGCRLYHSGDTCMYEGIWEKVRALTPDVMLLPINGRDAERLARNCLGNMTYQEAVDFAGLLKPALVVPTHFDMFNGNLEDPQKFIDYMAVKFPEQATHIPAYGKRTVVTV